MSLNTEFTTPPASFVSRLFNFDEFITGRLIKLIFLIGVVLILLGTVGGGGITALTSFAVGINQESPAAVFFGLFYFVLSLIAGCLAILLLRVYCEIMMVFFKINENLQAIRNRQ